MLPTKCPKCGADTLEVVYEEDEIDECLVITCRRCTYSWDTPTLDNINNNEE